MKKKILLLCPPFADYDNQICNKLIDMGFEVLLINSKEFLQKKLKYISSNFLQKVFRSKINKINIQINNTILNLTEDILFDYVLVFKGDSLFVSTVLELRKKNITAKFILYEWDSLKAFSYHHLIPHFDKVYSFDYNDCDNDVRIHYLALFFLDCYKDDGIKPIYENDLFFIGGNLIITSKNKKIGGNNILKSHFLDKSFYQRRSDILYNIVKKNSSLRRLFVIFSNDFFDPQKTRKISGFNFIKRKLSHNEIVLHLKKSRIVIDMHTPWQSGLTMRTIETMAMQRKIITTNENIKREPFYNEQNVLIFNPYELDFKIPINYLKSEFKYFDMTDYSLESFLKKLLH